MASGSDENMYTLFPNANIPKRAWPTATTENITKNDASEENDLRIVNENNDNLGIEIEALQKA